MDQCEYVAPLPDEPGSKEMEFIPACPPPLPPNEEPPPPPLQTSSDAEVMDVGSGGDGQSQTPAGDMQLNSGAQLLTKGSSSYKSHPTVIDQFQSDQSPRTARHAPAVRNFTPDLKLLKDVKISVSFTESCKSKDRKVLYTGAEAADQTAVDSNNTVNGELHVCPFAGSSNDKIVNNHEIANKRNEEAELDQEKKVEYAVLDDLEDFSENVMDVDEDGAEYAEFLTESMLQRDKMDGESLIYNYEDDFDNDVDALLEEGLHTSKKRRLDEKYEEESDHHSDGETSVQPMITKIKTVLKSRGRPPTEPLPDGWIMTFHNSGIPVYLHRETRVVTWSRPYFLGTGSIRKHDPPISSIPCLHYKKMKDNEEKEHNNDASGLPSESPSEKILDNNADEPDSTAGNLTSDEKEVPVEVTQGALGQVKAKVEVCKDESIGTFTLSNFPTRTTMIRDVAASWIAISLCLTRSSDQDPAVTSLVVARRPELYLVVRANKYTCAGERCQGACVDDAETLHPQKASRGKGIVRRWEVPDQDLRHPSDRTATQRILFPSSVVCSTVLHLFLYYTQEHPHATEQQQLLISSHELCLITTFLDLEDFRSYLEKRFDFEQVTVKKFRTWAERRQFNREVKRKQAGSERPILPANQKLITLSVQDAPTKKEFVINPNGKSEVCILHEYMQRVLKVRPVYNFFECGILNRHGYHSILQRHAFPSGWRLVGPSFIFQQDNDTKHRLCKGYLTRKESDGVLRQMTWPPQSPDLNPIEMVWGELDRRVKAKRPTSAKHLWELLQDYWKTISDDYLLKLIKRMPRVCKAVIKAKGGYFEEPRI
ncbi:unnamed protein product [Ranitomeya imitator]|uniref:WW domain-containing protein n=1 Tax=Ranitomeya imitator TaxID=111125 RepID=A0ABN9M9S1_9NEOB|nr:unnamed protein product [Ranitomeya imitator]